MLVFGRSNDVGNTTLRPKYNQNLTLLQCRVPAGLDDSTLVHVAQNPCDRDVNNIVRSSYVKESTNPPKDSMVIFLMGKIEFLRDETKIENIIERLLTLKSVLHDNQLSSYNSQQINKINKNFVDKDVDTDDIPVDYQLLARYNNMDIIIKELNKSLYRH